MLLRRSGDSQVMFVPNSEMARYMKGRTLVLRSLPSACPNVTMLPSERVARINHARGIPANGVDRAGPLVVLNRVAGERHVRARLHLGRAVGQELVARLRLAGERVHLVAQTREHRDHKTAGAAAGTGDCGIGPSRAPRQHG